MIWTIKISSKGQVVLPKAVRDRLVPHQSDLDKPDSAAMGVALVYHNPCDGVLGVKPGDKIVFVERQDRIELQAYGGDILSWYGALDVDTPQDWSAVQAETNRHRAKEVVRESEGH